MIDHDSIRVLAGGFGLAEGPAWDARRPDVVLVSDVLQGGVRRVPLVEGAEGPPYGLVDGRGVGGLAVHADGGLVVTGRTLVHAAPDGTVTELLTRPEDITGYNDLGVAPDGGVLVGALRIKPLKGELSTPADLVYVAPDGTASTWSGSEMVWPNGICFALDGRHVIVADFATGTLLRSPWEPGHASHLEPWVVTPNGAADGMSMDAEGNLWVALGPGSGIAVYNPSGTLLTVFQIPGRFVSSVCHAGADRRTLVVTTMHDGTTEAPNGTVLSVRVDVPGAPLPEARVRVPRS